MLNNVFLLDFKKLKLIMPLRHFTLLILSKMSVFLSKNESRIPQSILNNVFCFDLQKAENNYQRYHFSFFIFLPKKFVFLTRKAPPYFAQKRQMNPKIRRCFCFHEA